MNKPKARATPEDLFVHALRATGEDLTQSDLRLLASGLAAARQAYEKPLNEIEARAIDALIAYVADAQKVREDTVREILSSRYAIPEAKALPSRLYQEAVEFLVDLDMAKAVN